MNKITLLLLAWLLGSIHSVQSETHSASNTFVDPSCIDSPEECQQRAFQKEVLHKRCLSDPKWCEEFRTNLKQRREEQRALEKQCKEQPTQCVQLREQFKQQQEQRRKQLDEQKKEAQQKKKLAQQEWCKLHPLPCEKWKNEQRTIKEEYEAKLQELDKKYQVPGEVESQKIPPSRSQN